MKATKLNNQDLYYITFPLACTYHDKYTVVRAKSTQEAMLRVVEKIGRTFQSCYQRSVWFSLNLGNEKKLIPFKCLEKPECCGVNHSCK